MLFTTNASTSRSGWDFPKVPAKITGVSTGELSYGMPYEQRARVRISDESAADGERGFVYSQTAFGYDDHVSELLCHSLRIIFTTQGKATAHSSVSQDVFVNRLDGRLGDC